MSDFLAGKSVRKLTKGMRTVSASQAVTNATVDVFNIVGGRVFVHQILGRVTTEVGAGATNCRLTINPTGAAATNLCANLDIDGAAADTILGITGTAANALTSSTQLLASQATELMLPAGVIEMITSADRDGAITWEVFYTPIDDGAHITAA